MIRFRFVFVGFVGPAVPVAGALQVSGRVQVHAVLPRSAGQVRGAARHEAALRQAVARLRQLVSAQMKFRRRFPIKDLVSQDSNVPEEGGRAGRVADPGRQRTRLLSRTGLRPPQQALRSAQGPRLVPLHLHFARRQSLGF